MQGLIGQELGGYRIISQIGKGGMATVFKAFQPSLDRYVAVKVMPAYYAEQDDTFLRRFRREAKAIANLRHPNILIVIDYGEQEGTTYLIMEFVEAGTVTDLLGAPLAPARMAQLIGQVAGALQYAHGEGVVHRDIKPSNILLPKPDWPLLTDFGLAKIVGGSQLTQSGTVAGTPAYMSPEQGRGERVDARSDIYSLGVVLYEMATGVVPFHAETPMAVVVKHIIDPLPMPRSKNPDLPEGIERVILKALAKDPADRYQEASLLAEALSEAVNALPPELAQATPARPPAQATTLEASAAVAAAVQASALPAERASSSPEAGDVGPEARAAREPRPSELAESVPLLRRIPRPALIGAGALVLVALVFGALQLFGSDGTEPTDAPRAGEQLGTDGRASFEQGDAEQTVEELDLAIQSDPENIDLYFDRARALAAAGDFDAAITSIQEGIAIYADEPWVYESAAGMFMELGMTEQAVEAYQTSLEMDPAQTWLYYNMVEAYLENGMQEQAAEVLMRALEDPAISTDPGEVDSIGWYFLDLDRVDQAQVAFQTAIELGASFPSPWEGLVEIASRRNNPEVGLEILLELSQRFPEEAAYPENAAYFAWELGQREQAIGLFERAIELNPQNNGYYMNMANLLSELGREDEAEELLLRGLEQNPETPGFHADLAEFYAERERYEQAVPRFESAIELDPSEGYWYLYLGQALASLGRIEEAHDWLAGAVERAADDPWLHEGIGWTYFDLGDCGRAVEHWQLALDIDPSIESARQGIRECG